MDRQIILFVFLFSLMQNYFYKSIILKFIVLACILVNVLNIIY